MPVPPIFRAMTFDSADLKCALQLTGAALVRGFEGSIVEAIHEIKHSVLHNHVAYETGEHVRVSAEHQIYTPVAFSPADTLHWHHEDSFNPTWPRVAVFGCSRPAHTGGETPLVDTSRVCDRMSTSIIEKLELSGVCYERVFDQNIGRSWQQVFGVQRFEEAVEKAQQSEGSLTDEGERGIVYRFRRPAFHYYQGKRYWTNQILHWHMASLPIDVFELTRSGAIPTVRDARFGDGEPIEDALVQEVIEHHKSYETAFEWEAGDILIIDNLRIAHGRRPFSGTREHVAYFCGQVTSEITEEEL